MADVQFNVKGMSCMGCARSIERRLLSTPGVQAASVDLDAAIASVTFDDTVTNPSALEKVIESLGFDIVHSVGRQ